MDFVDIIFKLKRWFSVSWLVGLVTMMNVTKRYLLVSLGWAIFQGQLLFSILISEQQNLKPLWFLVSFLVSLVASALIDEIEQVLKYWLLSIVLSVLIVFTLIVFPMYIGVLSAVYVPVMVVGSIRPLASVLIVTTPLGLVGSFAGQVIRNRLL
jgi:hypothetical protein